MHRTLTILLVSLLLGVTTASAEVIDRIVAVVGGQIITKSDVDAAAAFGFALNLSDLIDRTLMLGEVRRVAPPDPAPAVLDTQIARIRARFATPDEFSRAMEVSGLDEAAVRASAADGLRLSVYLDERFASASQLADDEMQQADESGRARLIAERRQTLVNAWVAELRRRADITVLQ